MTVGIPGTGIGGLFYLAGALWLPVRGVFRRLRGERVQWAHALGQASLALGVLAGLWITGALIAFLLAPVLRASAGAGPHAAHRSNVVRVASIVAGVGTLSLVLAAVQVARVTVRRPAPRRRP